MILDLLRNLNPCQREAVEAMNGPLLIVAGAGSGKTSVLTTRIAYLMEHGIAPYHILAITFTNKAAAEMKDRVYKMVGDRAKEIWLSTFHSFCARLLRIEIEKLGNYKKNFVIYDSGDQQVLIKSCLKELNLDEKQYTPSGIQAAIGAAKNDMIDAAEFAQRAGSFHEQKIGEVYELYQKKLVANNALDFDDLLILAVRLLEKEPQVKEYYQEKFQYILVDEYQDTNQVQYRLTGLLAAKYRNLCVVGDSDQSIYRWRGADIRNILNFTNDYPEAKTIKLEQNYRSTQTILDAANAVIANNTNRPTKKLWTENVPGNKIQLYQAEDEKDEARFITDTIFKLKTIYRESYRGIAVLYRTNAQSRVIEEMLVKSSIPYTIVGGVKFYERKEIKDILSYLRVIFDPYDAVSLRRIINVPKRGIGATSVERLAEYAETAQITLFDAVSNADAVPKLSAKIRKALDELAALIFSLAALKDQVPVAALLEKLLADSGYVTELEQEHNPQADARIENLEELLSVAQDFASDGEEDTLENFLNHVSLVTDIDNLDLEQERVTLMTLHSAKGLEFPEVFLAGMEEGIFPHARTLMDEEELEEERRLCYVGITRAKNRLYLSCARMRTLYGRTVAYSPSRFLTEIPVHLWEAVNPRKAHTGFSSAASRPVSHTASGTSSHVSVLPPRQAITWQAGDRAMHTKWGIGTVLSVSGTGEGQQLKISFPNFGVRLLLAQYAPLSKVH